MLISFYIVFVFSNLLMPVLIAYFLYNGSVSFSYQNQIPWLMIFLIYPLYIIQFSQHKEQFKRIFTINRLLSTLETVDEENINV